MAGTAVAQRAGNRLEIGNMMQHARQMRERAPADPNLTPMVHPGDYRFSFVADGITRE